MHFYTLTTKDQKEKLRKQFHLQLHKKIKYLGINLPKEAKDLYSKNYKMLIKETEDNTSRCKDTPCSWIGRINTIRMLILSKAIYRVNIIRNTLPMAFFHKLEHFFLICMKIQKALNSQSNPEKEKWSWPPDIKL